jgi:hypothetical protein
MFEKSIQEQANRLSSVSNASKSQLTELTEEDIMKAFNP